MATQEPPPPPTTTDPPQEQWECIAPQPADYDGVHGEAPSVRYGHTAVLHERRMVVTHGYFFSDKRGSCFLDDTWAFDVDSKGSSRGSSSKRRPWKCLASSGPLGEGAPAPPTPCASSPSPDASPVVLPPARFHHTAVVHDGGMFLFGGTDGGQRNERSKADGGSGSFLFGPTAEMSDLWRFSLDGKGGTPRHKWQQLSMTVRAGGDEASSVSPSSVSPSSVSPSSVSPSSVDDSDGSNSEASGSPPVRSPTTRQLLLWEHPECGPGAATAATATAAAAAKGGAARRVVGGRVWPAPRAEHGAAFCSGRLWVYGGLRGDASGIPDGLEALGDLWSCALTKRVAEKRQQLVPPTPPTAAEVAEVAPSTPSTPSTPRAGGGHQPSSSSSSSSCYEVRWECRWEYHGGGAAGVVCNNDNAAGGAGGGSGSEESGSFHAVGARYGHACVPGRLSSSSSSSSSSYDGFFVVGGRRREMDFVQRSKGSSALPRVLGGGGGGGSGKVINRVRGDKRIVDDVWWCDTDALLRANGGLRVMWRRLAAPGHHPPPSWLPRFNFAAAAVAATAAAAAATASSGGGGGSGGSSGLVIFGGNVSTGLLRLPVDAWLLLHHDADSGGDGETTTVATAHRSGGVGGAAAAAAAAAAAPISGFEWVRLAATGVPDAEGHSQPYGRVHASVVVVPPHPTAAAKDGDKGHSIILFGGESTRPYMYHAGVWRASVRGVGV